MQTLSKYPATIRKSMPNSHWKEKKKKQVTVTFVRLGATTKEPAPSRSLPGIWPSGYLHGADKSKNLLVMAALKLKFLRKPYKGWPLF